MPYRVSLSQRLQTWTLKVIQSAKIKDTCACPGMSVENNLL